MWGKSARLPFEDPCRMLPSSVMTDIPSLIAVAKAGQSALSSVFAGCPSPMPAQMMLVGNALASAVAQTMLAEAKHDGRLISLIFRIAAWASIGHRNGLCERFSKLVVRRQLLRPAFRPYSRRESDDR